MQAHNSSTVTEEEGAGTASGTEGNEGGETPTNQQAESDTEGVLTF